MTKGQKTRQNIIAQAAAVFNQKGFSGSSMAELCEVTGIQKGGLYRHFASKDELALEAFDYAAGIAREARFITREEAAALTPLEQLKMTLQRFVEPSRELVPGGCPVFNAAVDSDDAHPALRASVEQVLSDWLRRVADTVRASQQVGELPPSVNPEHVALRIVSSLEGALVISRIRRSREPLRVIADELVEWLEELARK